MSDSDRRDVHRDENFESAERPNHTGDSGGVHSEYNREETQTHGYRHGEQQGRHQHHEHGHSHSHNPPHQSESEWQQNPGVSNGYDTTGPNAPTDPRADLSGGQQPTTGHRIDADVNHNGTSEASMPPHAEHTERQAPPPNGHEHYQEPIEEPINDSHPDDNVPYGKENEKEQIDLGFIDRGEEDEEDEDEESTEQEYIRILPVREEVNSETVTRSLFGLHRYGNGKKLPFDMELHIDSIDPLSNFEFLIYKPANEAQFQFYVGPGERGDVNCDRLESATRSQYPEDFEFERKMFDINDVFDETPHMVRYEGIEERRKDWMTTLATFDTEQSKRSPLSNLLETTIQEDGAVIYQVIFEPRSDWSTKAERQKGLLKRGVHTTGGMFLQTFLDGLIGVSDEEKRERHRGDTPEEIGGTIMDTEVGGARAGHSRMAQIDIKDPAHTYNVGIRVAAESQAAAENLQDALNQLSGHFYSIDGNYLGQNENEFERMLKHGITYPHGLEAMSRRKPMFVCNIKELASFITVPSIDALPKASRGGTGGKPAAQSALTSPNEKVFRKFSRGMTIGHAVTALRDSTQQREGISTIESVNEWWNHLKQRDAIALSAGDLTHHYIRAATTGSGKTVATINDMLTTHYYLKGPTILIDPKGGAMCENYLRCHRALFKTVDNVEYIKIPEKDGKIPGIPFFDLRPLIRGAGKDRDVAIQDVIDHYFQLLRFVLGKNTVEQAFVANEILKGFIKALFDEEHGADYFTIGDLLEAARDFQHYGREIEDVEKAIKEGDENLGKAMPKVSDKQVESILLSHLEKEANQFMNTTDAVLNRIRKLKERDFVWDMLSFEVPEEYWDDEIDWYDREQVPMLDLKHILNSNKVLLIDTGDLRSESSEIFTVLFLSHLWTSVQSLWTPDDEHYIANVIIEESANIARNEIVYRELLPQGREFNLSLGLIMQYPEQVLDDDPRANRRAYQEILNNVNTKIIGNIATDDLLADSLFHEKLNQDEIKDRIAGLRRGEWVVQLPSTGFHEQKPEILTLRPLPIPPGHSESPINISPKTESVRKRSRDLHCLNRDDEFINSDIDIAFGAKQDDDDEEDTEGGEEAELEDTEDDEINESDLTYEQRSFLDDIFDAYSDDVEVLTLGTSMTKFRHSGTAKELEEMGLLERINVGGNVIYFRPTKQAEFITDRKVSEKDGGEYGNESPKHFLGVQLAKAYYKQQGYEVEVYPPLDDGKEKADAIAHPTNQSPDDRKKVIEVETTPEHKPHVLEDRRKLANQDGDAIWIVNNNEDLETLLGKLSEEIEGLPSGKSRNLEKINEKLNGGGIDEAQTLNSLYKSIE